MAEIGGAVLRVQTGKARESDVYAILEELMTNAEFRESRAGAIGQLTAEIPPPQRQETCRAMAILLLTDFVPPDDYDPTTESGLYHKTTPFFVRHCAPPPNGPWQETKHVQAEYNSKAQAQYVNVSGYLRDILRALEDMWNCGGHLLK